MCNVLHRTMRLHTCSPAGGAIGKVVEALGGRAFLEEVGHWRWALRFYSPVPLPVYSLPPDTWMQCDRPPHVPARLPCLPCRAMMDFTPSTVNHNKLFLPQLPTPTREATVYLPSRHTHVFFWDPGCLLLYLLVPPLLNILPCLQGVLLRPLSCGTVNTSGTPWNYSSFPLDDRWPTNELPFPKRGIKTQPLTSWCHSSGGKTLEKRAEKSRQLERCPCSSRRQTPRNLTGKPRASW